MSEFELRKILEARRRYTSDDAFVSDYLTIYPPRGPEDEIRESLEEYRKWRYGDLNDYERESIATFARAWSQGKYRPPEIEVDL